MRIIVEYNLLKVYHIAMIKAVSTALCALPAAEMSIRFTGHFYRVYVGQDKREGSIMSGNLIGAVFLAACAWEMFPGGRQVGAIIVIVNAYFAEDNELIQTYTGRRPMMAVLLGMGFYGATSAKTSSIFFKVLENVKF